MSLLFVQISVSIDGYIEDADGGLEWFTADRTVEAFATETLRAIGGMVFGRTAHALLAGFWKNASAHDASPDLPEQARLMNSLPKYVLTHGTPDIEWEHSFPVQLDDVAQIKRQSALPIALFAGAAAARAVLAAGLVDELRLIRYPLLLGRGTPLFDGEGQRRDLSLIEERQFSSGAIVTRYAVHDSPG